MMSTSCRAGLVVALVVACLLVARTERESLASCGYVLQVPCCTNVNPGGGGCGCSELNGECACVNGSGQAQNGTQKICFTGPFDFSNLGPDQGSLILDGPVANCFQQNKCMTPQGHPNGCAYNPSCSPGSGEGCSWVQIGKIATQNTFVTGGVCSGGGSAH